MVRVVADMSISLHGYVTGPHDSRENPFGGGTGMLHDWFGKAATDEDRRVPRLFMTVSERWSWVVARSPKNEGDAGWGEFDPAGEALVNGTVSMDSFPSAPLA